MSAELVARADAHRAKMKVREETPGSSYHDNDRDPTQPARFVAPQKNGVARSSEAVVAFDDAEGEEVVFAGGDAGRVLAALAGWKKSMGSVDPVTLPGTERKLVLTIIPRLAAADDAGTPRLAVRRSWWNDVLFALQARGMNVAGAPLVPHEGSP